MIHLNLEDVLAMPDRKRATLMNYLSGFKSANLIGTTDGQHRHNLAIFNSVVHIGANPPYLGFILRPTTVERHTYDNIKTTGYYTINHIHENFYAKAHQTSAKYPKETSEFDAVGLTPEIKGNFFAPYVQESPIKLGLQFQEEIIVPCNGTILMVGKVLEVWLPAQSVAEDGHLNLSAHGVIAISGLDTYHSTAKLAQLPYAKRPSK